jgi:hypothetical protein
MPSAAIERRAVQRDQHRPEPASVLRSASLGVDASQRLAAVILQRPVVGDRGAIGPLQAGPPPEALIVPTLLYAVIIEEGPPDILTAPGAAPCYLEGNGGAADPR